MSSELNLMKLVSPSFLHSFLLALSHVILYEKYNKVLPKLGFIFTYDKNVYSLFPDHILHRLKCKVQRIF
jgi:hypothetical protein